MSAFKFITLLWKYIRPYRWAVLFILTGLSIELCYEAALRYSLKFLVDEAILKKDFELFFLIFAFLGIGGIFYTVFCISCDYYWARYGVLVINGLNQDLFCHLQKLPIGYFDRKSTGDLIARFTSDTAIIDTAMVMALPMAFLSIGELMISSILLYKLHSVFFSGILIGILFSLFLPRLFASKTASASYALRDYTGKISSFLQENISSQKTIKAYGLENKSINDFRERLNRFFNIASRSFFLSYLSQRLPNISFLLLNVIVMLFGGFLAMRGELSIGTMVSYQVIFLGLSAAINHMTWVVPSIISATAAMQRIQEVFVVPITEEIGNADDFSPRLKGHIEYRNVNFSHSPDKPIIQDLSLEIEAGNYAVFVGHSGSGKTSFANLLLRFYDVTSGTIFIDDIDIRSISPTGLRGQIGFVSQNISLFNISIADNILLGNPDASHSELVTAAESAEIHDFVMSLPQGYNTLCGESGSLLSGGECQRIALARALVRKPALLLLDEVTATLDPLAELSIRKTLRNLRSQCTVIAITHKLNLATDADLVFVMDNGRIVEKGNHASLLAENGLYTRFWKETEID